MDTYKIIRQFQNRESSEIEWGLSLEEAQLHCSNPETSSCTTTRRSDLTRQYGHWFDRYEKEGNIMQYLNDIIAWEQGELSEEDTVALFQTLIDNGVAWQLQGCYGRTARQLIDLGLCVE